MEDPNAPATKGDIAELRADLKGDTAEFRAELKGDIAGHRAELKGDIAGLRAELKGDIAEVKAELKGDIAEVKAELKSDIADVNTQMVQLRSETHHMYNDLVERIADSETRLLKAFYNYADSNQQRLAQVDSEQTGFRNRLGSIETRLLEVEKRLNMPPAA